MDVSKLRRSTNVRDVRGQPLPAAMTIRGRPSKETAKKAPFRAVGEQEFKEAEKRWSRK